jgi:hypothetical protein
MHLDSSDLLPELLLVFDRISTPLKKIGKLSDTYAVSNPTRSIAWSQTTVKAVEEHTLADPNAIDQEFAIHFVAESPSNPNIYIRLLPR